MNNDDYRKTNSNCYIGLRYLNSGQDMLFSWLMLLIFFFVVPCVFSFSYVFDMATNGGLVFLVAFALVFSYCVKDNAVLLYRIACESDVLRNFHHRLRPNTDFKEYSGSIVAKHINNLNIMWKRSGKKQVDQGTLIEVLHAKLKNDGSIVVVASNIMITLGLIGTISGLISSIGGLQESSGVAGLMGGVTKAIDGMGVAFYTTLIGSMLGGISLRILHFYVDKQIDAFVFTMAEVVETHVVSSLKMAERKSDLRDVALATINALREMDMIKEDYYESAESSISA